MAGIAVPVAASNGASAPAPAPAARVDEAAGAARLLEQAFDFYDAGKYDEALGSCQAAIALDPDGSTAHSLLGMIYERLGKTAEAVQQYQLVLRMNPDSIADAIKLDTLVSSQKLGGRRGLVDLFGAGKRAPVAVGALVAVAVLTLGGWATTRALNSGAGSLRQPALRATHGPVPGASLPPSSAAAPVVPGTSAGTTAPAAPGAAPAATAAVSEAGRALPAPPPANAFPGLRGAYPPGAHSAAGTPVASSGSAERHEARPGYLPPAPVLNVEKIDPKQAAPLRDVPGAALPATPRAPHSGRGPVPVLPPASESVVLRPAGTASPSPTLPAASTAPPEPASARINIQPLDNTAAPAARSPQPASEPPAVVPPSRPATLRDALQHQQMAAYYRRQGDDQAAYSEYEAARDLFREVQQHGGQEAAVAARGAVAAQNGMARLQGP